jgi:hypothetical protein
VFIPKKWVAKIVLAVLIAAAEAVVSESTKKRR